MGNFFNACTDVQEGQMLTNLDSTNVKQLKNGLFGPSPKNIADFDPRRTRFRESRNKSKFQTITDETSNGKPKIKYSPVDLSSASDTATDSEAEGLRKKRKKRKRKKKPIKYDYNYEKHNTHHHDHDNEGIDLEKGASLPIPTTPKLPQTSIEKRHSDTTVTTINTINTISTMHSIQTLNSNHTNTTTVTYSRSENIVQTHKPNPKRTENKSNHDSESSDYYDENVRTPKTFTNSNLPTIPDPEPIMESHSLPSTTLQKKCSDDGSVHGQHAHSADTLNLKHNNGYKFSFIPSEPSIIHTAVTAPASFANFKHSTAKKQTRSYTPTPPSPKPAQIAAIFFQLTSLKKLDNGSQINVILDEFLTDYNMYAAQFNIPYKYLFSYDIIGNLIFAWNLGVKTINSTLITYSIQALCKFTQRDEFRAPFLAQHGINLIDKTLSIPSLQSPQQSSKNMHPLAAIASANSVDFVSNSFSHILAVLKITRDICRLDVIDTMLWCTTKIHQKVLSTMKRDYDEVRITRACKDTLLALLDAAYEIGEEIMNDSQMHDMIDSFLLSTKNEYLLTRTNSYSSYKSQHTLPRIDESAAGSTRSLLQLSLFSSMNSHRGDMEQVTVNKHIIKHQKRKNLLELQEQKTLTKPTKTGSSAEFVRDTDLDLLRQISAMTHVSEVSEYETDASSQEDIGTTRPVPQYLLSVSQEFDTDPDTEHIRTGTLIRIPSEKSGISIISDMDTDEHGTPSSVHTQLIYGLSEADSILSLRDYDAMVDASKERMSGIDEVEKFEQHSDYNDEEKSHTVPMSSTQLQSMKERMENGLTIDMHSVVSMDDDGVVIDIELQQYQLLYINSLFHILYKIITLEKMKEINVTISRPTSVRNSGQTFMGLLKSRRNRDKSDRISGGTAGGLSNMDAVYMSDSEMVYKNRNSRKLKHVNHKKNRLLEAFFKSLSFKNLFKLLKCYQLSGYNAAEAMGDDLYDNQFVNKAFVKQMNPDSDSSDADKEMVSVEILACKILHKILSYSDIADKLLLSDELDVIGILVGLLFQHQNNIDLIIYILDIFSKVTKDNEDIRELLLSPDYFDKFLRSLDVWWVVFIKSSLLAHGLDVDGSMNVKNAMLGFHVLSTECMGAVGTKSSVNTELHIEVVNAMLKFFQILSETNGFDMVAYGINDRILVLLDYYVNMSSQYDNEGGDDDDLFIFNDKQHQECLSLCMECISNLATDINMLLEFVCSGTVEKLSTICWSFRHCSVMIKKCCNVINKLLKLQQSGREIVKRKQNVLKPLICCIKYLFKKAFVDNNINGGVQLIIACKIFPNNNNSDMLREYESDDDEYEYETDEYEEDESEYSDSEQTDSKEEETFAQNKKAIFQRKVRVATGTTNRHSQHMSRGIHANLRDLKDLFSVFTNISCFDELCVETIESDLMLLLIELLSNKMLLIHSHMMMSLVVSDLLQHLTKNKKGAKLLIESNQFAISKHICNAIENNIDNRGVVLKYLRALQNLKNANPQILKQQLIRNKCIDFLNNVDVQYQTVFNQMIHQILNDDRQSAEECDEDEEEEEESEEEESNDPHSQKQ